MNSFFDIKNKIKFIYDKNQEQSQDIDNVETINNNLTYQTKRNATSVYFFSKIRDFSIDWSQMEQQSALSSQYKVWEIEWDIFDIRLLPFIDIKFMYRRYDGNIPDDMTISPSLSKIFEIEDIEGETSEYYKKVKLTASAHFTIYSLTNVYEARLNVLFINPRQYI